MPPTEALSRDDYTVGWVTALPLELAAATAMLDEDHKRPSNFRQPSTDHNTYTWGRIEEHNVVLASLPAGVYGTVSAATVASSLLSSFPHLQVGLMVGIGAGIPRPGYDIRLGDVVVSNPGGRTGGVIQYDLGKRLAGGRFERKGSLNMPPEVLLTALATLQARHERQPSNVPQILEQMLRNNPFMAEPQDERPGYGYQGEENDRLFAPDYQHVGGLTCEGCDRDKELERKKRKSSAPRIHYGIIASGNTLVKDSSTRDSIIEGLDEDCICFEMEAAGLMNSFPCLVIRGICDYADSHKNDRWQRCAAAAAAAYAREFLSVVPEVSAPSPRRTNKRLTDEAKQSLILKALKFDAMDERFHDVSKEAENTFRWIFEDKTNDGFSRRSVMFKSWLTSGSGIFHICGKLGSGKSTLMKHIWRNSQTAQSLQLWAQGLKKQLVTAQFFFWKPGCRRQKSFAGLIRSLLAQILRQCPEMIDTLFSSNLNSTTWPIHGDTFEITISDDEAEEAFNRLIHHEAIRSTYCFCFFIDGLDEFEEKDRKHTDLATALNEWASGDVIKLCVSSRELGVFLFDLSVTRKIKLQDFTYHDIKTLVHQTLNEHVHFQWLMKEDSDSCKRLLERVTEKAEGVFLWVVLASKQLFEGLEDRYSVDDLLGTLRNIPVDLKELFCNRLESIPDGQRRKSFCLLSIMAKLYELRDDSYPAYFTMFKASFLNDYFRDPAFAEKRGSQEMSDREVNERLAQSKAQWLGNCEGLIQARPSDQTCDWFEKDELRFTHRSVPEYLQENGSQFEGVDIFNLFAQSLLAALKASPAVPHNEGANDCQLETIKALLLILREYPMMSKLHYFPLLEQIEATLQEKQAQSPPGFAESRWIEFRPSRVRCEQRKLYLSLPHIACEALFHEYVQWKFKYTPASHQVNEWESVEYLSSVIDGIRKENNPTRARETLRVLFLQGCNPNWCSPNPEAFYDDGYDPWFRLLYHDWLSVPPSEAKWAAIETFLEFGAYHPHWTCDPSSEYPVVTFTFGENKRLSWEADIEFKQGKLPPCLLGYRWISLQQWVEFQKPENGEAVLKLLEKPHHPSD